MHDHAHDHSHSHDHSHGTPHKRLLWTLLVTLVIMVAEAVGGYLSGSLALMADAGHMLTDVLALLVAFVASVWSKKPADQRRTYGYRRVEILAALLNGVALVVVSLAIAREAVERWMSPQEVNLSLMAGVAAVGLVANLIGLGILGHARHDLNVRGAFLHVVGDTLSSAAVLIAAAVIYFTGWTRLDPILSVLIAVVIVITSFSLLREVIEVLLEAAPRGIDTAQVRTAIGQVPGVAEVHDLHVWSIASGLPALSAHVLVNAPHEHHEILLAIQKQLRERFAIEHSTLQIERQLDAECGACQPVHAHAHK